ncbi:hypothetical protein J5TS2_42100 [Brevibacillus halotolerans]|nr:hypothetical protein J5TS2_42100 [Brevibacillus halotolerans]
MTAYRAFQQFAENVGLMGAGRLVGAFPKLVMDAVPQLQRNQRLVYTIHQQEIRVLTFAAFLSPIDNLIVSNLSDVHG